MTTATNYDEVHVLVFEYHDIKMACKVTENTVNPILGTRTIKFIPFEDSIHPYPLAFDPPLIEHAVGESNGFAHHWEKLNYAFALPNPADFPHLSGITDDDMAVLRRYAAVCRQLAGALRYKWHVYTVAPPAVSGGEVENLTLAA
jgi:hypothetical protein